MREEDPQIDPPSFEHLTVEEKVQCLTDAMRLMEMKVGMTRITDDHGVPHNSPLVQISVNKGNLDQVLKSFKAKPPAELAIFLGSLIASAAGTYLEHGVEMIAALAPPPDAGLQDHQRVREFARGLIKTMLIDFLAKHSDGRDTINFYYNKDDGHGTD